MSMSRISLCCFATLLPTFADLGQAACTCDTNVNWVNGAAYSQESLTDYCGTPGGCSGNPRYGAPNDNERAVAYCQNKCENGLGPASSTCAGFFYQRHTNGHEICGYFNSRPDLSNAVWHGHSTGSRVCQCSTVHTTTPVATTTTPRSDIECRVGTPDSFPGSTLTGYTRLAGYGTRELCEQQVFSLGQPIVAFSFSCHGTLRSSCKCDYWTGGYYSPSSYHEQAPFQTCFVTSTGVLTTPEPTSTTTTSTVTTVTTPVPPQVVSSCRVGRPHSYSFSTFTGYTRVPGYGTRETCEQHVLSLGQPIVAFSWTCYGSCKCDYWTGGHNTPGSYDDRAPFETCFVIPNVSR